MIFFALAIYLSAARYFWLDFPEEKPSERWATALLWPLWLPFCAFVAVCEDLAQMWGF